ncbi:MAG: DNA/RNA nuclease SfsA [Thermoplasmataceae archaeon]
MKHTPIFTDLPAGTAVLDIAFPMEEAVVIERPNRFLVMVENRNKVIRCHLHDPGRLKELIFPGNTVLIREQAGVKTQFSVTAARSSNEWVITDTRFHHPIARRFLPEDVQREVRVENHRIDFAYGDTYLEVKGGTLLENGIAVFPDAPTSRGRDHLRLLQQLRLRGHNAELLVLIFRRDAKVFMPNFRTDPDFSREFYRCLDAGVSVRVLRFGFDGSRVTYFGRIPVLDKDGMKIN